MATTVLDVVSQALADANVTDRDESPPAADSDAALDLLNQMLALWQIENVYVYAQQDTSFSPDGAVSYTVGTGADVDMARPSKIDAIYWRSGTIDYPVSIIETFEQYEALAQKTQEGEPLYAFYLPSYPTGKLYLFPQPSTGSVHLVSNVALPADNALADDLLLPPEYVMPVRSNLAVLVCGAYGAPVRPSIAATAAASLRVLRRNNLRIQPLLMPPAIPLGGRSDIFSG